MPDRDIGTQVRLWRSHLQLKQSELEERAGLAHNAVSRIETGAVSPRFETVEGLARAMGISVEELQFRVPPESRGPTDQSSSADLLARLEALPASTRDDLLRIFHSLIDLAQGDR